MRMLYEFQNGYLPLHLETHKQKSVKIRGKQTIRSYLIYSNNTQESTSMTDPHNEYLLYYCITKRPCRGFTATLFVARCKPPHTWYQYSWPSWTCDPCAEDRVWIPLLSTSCSPPTLLCRNEASHTREAHCPDVMRLLGWCVNTNRFGPPGAGESQWGLTPAAATNPNSLCFSCQPAMMQRKTAGPKTPK